MASRRISRYANSIVRESAWEDKPDFGYKFVRSFLDSRRDLPLSVEEKWLISFFRMERYHIYNRHVAEALSWTESHRTKHKAVVEAFLVCGKLSIPDIAQKTALHAASITAYEQLFFNVRDRLEDNVYISNLVFPEGIVDQLRPNYFLTTSPEDLYLRAGYTAGSDDILFFAGMKGGNTLDDEAANLLETNIMNEASRYARNGGLGQRNMPQISSAKAIIVAKKSAGTGDRPPDDSGWSDMGSMIRSQLMEKSEQTVDDILGGGKSIEVESEEIALPNED